MNRLDRVLGVLLALRGGDTVSATELARQFEVSTRTIYRDIEGLASIGVPVYAEMGRVGGFRLMEGYFVPPVMFTPAETVSLLLGLTHIRSLRARPSAAELDTATQKLLAALPDHLRQTLTDAQRVIGFEGPPGDAFHLELTLPDPDPAVLRDAGAEGQVVGQFLQAVLDGRTVRLDYRSPYRRAAENLDVQPYGVIWDRDWWYLVGKSLGREARERVWRSDRVLALRLGHPTDTAPDAYDVRTHLGRAWLRTAMDGWRARAPVTVRVTPDQAQRLQKDWYYQHAHYATDADGQVRVTWGEGDPMPVLELVRWLGPGAELLTPVAWRVRLRDELRAMLALYP